MGLGGAFVPTGRIFLSLWVLGWEDRRFRISSPAQPSLPEGGHTFPKPTAASLKVQLIGSQTLLALLLVPKG